MTYFDFYNITPSFTPDQKLVKQKFYELSRTYHPDFYVNESEEKQQEILELSTYNNKAYQTLTNPNKLTEYVLSLNGEISESEKYALPQSFLLEMMDVNDALMELELEQNENSVKDLERNIDEIEHQLNLKQASFFAVYEKTKDKTALKNVKDIYYRKKYISRIKESIAVIKNRTL